MGKEYSAEELNSLSKDALIYKRDNKLSKLTAEKRVRKRNLLIKPLVESFFAWAKEMLNTLEISPKSKTAEGLNYCINQEKYLKVFLDDGDVPLDNNATEGALRGFCIGKHNWRVIDSIDGAKTSAVVYSIAETAKANQLNPYEYFEYLLETIPKHMEDKNLDFLEKLLPWSKHLPERCHMKISEKYATEMRLKNNKVLMIYRLRRNFQTVVVKQKQDNA